MVDVIKISKKVLARLSVMGYELKGKNYDEQLIFPQKDRISEQELRLLFIEEFKKENKALFYSIETPTKYKYSFGKKYEDIKVYPEGQSASLDMCVFKRTPKNYERILNIEFKHKNASTKKIGKDVLKLIHEKQNGVFIYLLENTNIGTFINDSKNREGVFDKLYKSFTDFKDNWENEDKTIHLVILSLEQKKNKLPNPVLIHRKINKSNLDILEYIFYKDKGCGNITEIEGNGWDVETPTSANTPPAKLPGY